MVITTLYDVNNNIFELVKETEKAVCLKCDRGDFWLPKSALEFYRPRAKNVLNERETEMVYYCNIPYWLLQTKSRTNRI